MRNIAILAVVLALAGNAGAAGFRLAEQSAKATGMGNSFVAVANDASAAWYNPAAMTSLEGTNLSMGSVMVAPSMDHSNIGSPLKVDKITNKLHVPPHLYLTRKIDQKFSAGLSVNAPFGLSTQWDAGAATTRKVATRSEIAAVDYNLSGAYKATEKISVAAGIAYVMVDATLNKNWPTNAWEIQLEGDGNGVGFNTAVMYKHDAKWNFGANYRSQVKIKLEGEMKGYGTATAITPVKTELTLPDMLQLGAAYRHNDSWLFSAEADYTNWTSYRQIVIKRQSNSSVVSTDIKNWKSVWAFRAGTEYKVSEAWKARAGIFYDMNPVQEKYFETRVPDSDRLAFSIGAGYTKGNITVDVSYMYLKFMERTIHDSLQDNGAGVGATTLNGKYNASAALPALTVSYKF